MEEELIELRKENKRLKKKLKKLRKVIKKWEKSKNERMDRYINNILTTCRNRKL